jgi:hypothetical protein
MYAVSSSLFSNNKALGEKLNPSTHGTTIVISVTKNVLKHLLEKTEALGIGRCIS